MKTELTSTDKENIKKAKSLITSAQFLTHEAEKIIKQATQDVLRGLDEELKWQKMDELAYDLPDSVAKFYAIQYAQAVKEKWEKSRKSPSVNPNDAPEGYIATQGNSISCDGCAFKGHNSNDECHDRSCNDYERKDGLNVIFKKKI